MEIKRIINALRNYPRLHQKLCFRKEDKGESRGYVKQEVQKREALPKYPFFGYLQGRYQDKRAFLKVFGQLLESTLLL